MELECVKPMLKTSTKTKSQKLRLIVKPLPSWRTCPPAGFHIAAPVWNILSAGSDIVASPRPVPPAGGSLSETHHLLDLRDTTQAFTHWNLTMSQMTYCSHSLIFACINFQKLEYFCIMCAQHSFS